jgi:hypothetical protein
MLSLRVSKAERRQLQMLRAEKGHPNLSVTMRVLMGFPPAGPHDEAFIEGADDIDSVAKMCNLIVQMIDRIDQLIQQNTLIARHVGVPYAERNHITPGAALEHRPNGAKHPELPEGFQR